MGMKKKFEGKVIIVGAGSIGAEYYKSIWDKSSGKELIPIDADHRELISMSDAQKKGIDKIMGCCLSEVP